MGISHIVFYIYLLTSLERNVQYMFFCKLRQKAILCNVGDVTDLED